MDEDHLLIRAAMTQAMLREVEGNLRAATQKEYRESSRVINKEMYDKFKVSVDMERGRKRIVECGERKERDGAKNLSKGLWIKGKRRKE